MEWKTIDTAPKDGSLILVNDTNEDMVSYVFAKWLKYNEWSGWVYDDEILNDCNPEGPKPTHWLPIPPLLLNLEIMK